ncbi:hypothetical protein GCM10017557_25880 [Streptomyces aurantiacus]|uniref:Uncharacterized protein n=1 Tax=Streptomyces aurantiacus TaxID=47760 RepID=A0A7G1NXR1_9ACTN|nr:hypothetical protein GCM10017557_25880 [Streptomyces aurantiacus]
MAVVVAPVVTREGGARAADDESAAGGGYAETGDSGTQGHGGLLRKWGTGLTDRHIKSALRRAPAMLSHRGG